MIHRRRAYRFIPIILLTLASLATRVGFASYGFFEYETSPPSPLLGREFSLVICYYLPSLFIFLGLQIFGPLGILASLADVRNDRHFREEIALTHVSPYSFLAMHGGPALFAGIMPILVLIPTDLWLVASYYVIASFELGTAVFGAFLIMILLIELYLLLGLIALLNVFRQRSWWNVLLLLFGWPLISITGYLVPIAIIRFMDDTPPIIAAIGTFGLMIMFITSLAAVLVLIYRHVAKIMFQFE